MARQIPRGRGWKTWSPNRQKTNRGRRLGAREEIRNEGMEAQDMEILRFL
jgi:hypothetical protein